MLKLLFIFNLKDKRVGLDFKLSTNNLNERNRADIPCPFPTLPGHDRRAARDGASTSIRRLRRPNASSSDPLEFLDR